MAHSQLSLSDQPHRDLLTLSGRHHQARISPFLLLTATCCAALYYLCACCTVLCRAPSLFRRFGAAGEVAVDLLARLLSFDPARRCSSEEAMAHEYFEDAIALAMVRGFRGAVGWALGFTNSGWVSGFAICRDLIDTAL